MIRLGKLKEEDMKTSFKVDWNCDGSDEIVCIMSEQYSLDFQVEYAPDGIQYTKKQYIRGQGQYVNAFEYSNRIIVMQSGTGVGQAYIRLITFIILILHLQQLIIRFRIMALSE